jgi:hypothetical protein
MAVFGPGLWIATMTCSFSGTGTSRKPHRQTGMAASRKLPFGNRLLVLLLALAAALVFLLVRARSGSRLL